MIHNPETNTPATPSCPICGTEGDCPWCARGIAYPDDESDATITSIITTMVHAGLSDPPPDDAHEPEPDFPTWQCSICCLGDDCECYDDDYGDAMAEGAMGSYNGKTSLDFDPPGDNPMGDSEGDPEPPDRPRRISLYALLVAECQAELDARFGLAEPVVMVMDVDYSPVGWPV